MYSVISITRKNFLIEKHKSNKGQFLENLAIGDLLQVNLPISMTCHEKPQKHSQFRILTSFLFSTYKFYARLMFFN